MNATSPKPPALPRPPALSAGQFYGAVQESWRTHLVTLTLLRHANRRAVPIHSHANIYIALLLEGGYREWIGDEEIVYEPLTAVFHPAGLVHRDEITAPRSLFFAIEIDPAMIGAHGRRRELRSVRDLSGGPAVWSMLRLLEALRGHRRDALEAEEPVVEILEQLLGPADETAAPPRWLARVEARLRDDYADPASLRELGELAGVHPVHVARVFRRRRGCSIRAFLHAQRVLHVSRAIASGTPLAEAALAAGFCDQSHMTRVFKAVTGMTPVRYRAIAAR